MGRITRPAYEYPVLAVPVLIRITGTATDVQHSYGSAGRRWHVCDSAALGPCGLLGRRYSYE